MARQLRLQLQQPARFRRDEFIVSASNAEAVRAVDAWPSWFGGCLALVGPVASGKSHLAQAWAAQAGAAVVGAGDSALADLGSVQGRPVLFEDADRGFADETLFHLINMAGTPGGGLLLTARTAPQSWPANLPDLRSRLNALPVAVLSEPDDALLADLLLSFFRQRNIRPADDVIPYLVRRIERSATSARDVVERMDEAAIAGHRQINRAFARQFFEIEGESFDFDD